MFNSHNLGTAVLVIAWAFAGLGVTVVSTRYYARLKILKRFTIDDALIFVTLVSPVNYSVYMSKLSCH
jgi:hypothetical protein